MVKECLDRKFQVIIHLDSKSKQTILEHNSFSNYHNLVIGNSVNVKRGHFSIVEATMALLEESKNLSFDYFHLISGEDLPIKSESAFDHFFTTNSGKNFINNFNIPVVSPIYPFNNSIFSDSFVFKDKLPQENYQHAFFKDGIGLVDTYHFHENSSLGRLIGKLTKYNTFKKLYHLLAHRNPPKLAYQGGSAWFSITNEMVLYLISYSRANPKVLNYFKHVLFPDEIYFQTIALQSPLKDTVVNSDLRYINWDHPVNHGPGIINYSEVNEIIKCNGFFARKFDLELYPEILSNLHPKN